MLVGCLCADSDFFSDSGSGWEQFSINSPLSFIRSKASSCIFSHAFALRWWDSLSPKRVGRAFGRSDQSLRGHSDHDDKTQGWSCLHSSQSWLLVFICVHMIFFFLHKWYHTQWDWHATYCANEAPMVSYHMCCFASCIFTQLFV